MKGTPYEEDLKVIRDETLRCRRIVRGILDFARENEPLKEPADLNEVIDETLCASSRRTSIFQNVEIVRDFDPDLPHGPGGRRPDQVRSSATWPSTRPTPCPTAAG